MSRPCPIREIGQFKALASPVRGEIVDVVDLLGPTTIAEIASALGRPADSLYYHLRRLLHVGLLVQRGTRNVDGHESAVYDVPGRPMHLRYSHSQREHIRALVRSVAGMLRLAERDFRAAFESGLVRSDEGKRNVVHSRALGWYTDAEIRKMRAEIQDIIGEFRGSACKRGKGKKLYALTAILVPLEDRGKRGD